MALIQCKECGKEISASAESCPHCGYKTKQGEIKTENKALRTKQWIHTGMFLLGLILLVTNVGTLLDRLEEWEVADGIIRDIWGSDKVTFMEYLDVHDDKGAFWATIIGMILIPWGAVGALANRSLYKHNKIEAVNAAGQCNTVKTDVAQTVQKQWWTCVKCGQKNTVAYCQSCGTSKSWSEAQTKKDAAEQKPAACPQCNAVVQPGDAFCIHCGTKINK